MLCMVTCLTVVSVVYVLIVTLGSEKGSKVLGARHLMLCFWAGKWWAQRSVGSAWQSMQLIRTLKRQAKAEEKKALGSSNSASGDAELVSGVLVTVNGESLESKSRALEEEP